MRIYLVTDEGLLLGKDLYRTVEAAVKGGVSMVQLREKESSTREFIERAIRLKEVLSPYGIPLIINDRVDVALAADADGVHVGQSDMPYEMVKRLLPEGKIIGLSVESPEQVLEANDYDLDYVAASSRDFLLQRRQILSWNGDWTVCVGSSPFPVIHWSQPGEFSDNVASIFQAGADSVAVVSAIVSADDPEHAARELLEKSYMLPSESC